jgi:hypothetical protein
VKAVARRAGVGLLVLAALVLGRVVSTALPVDDRIGEPFVRSGAVEEEVDLRYARVSVGEPEGSTVADASGSLLATSGVWVLIPVTVVAEGEPRRLAYATVVGSDGRTYAASGMRSQLALGRATPGLPHYGAVLVELPGDAAVGAHLQLALDRWDQRADDMAEIDLAITAADVEAWQATDDPVRLPSPSDTPPETS